MTQDWAGEHARRGRLRVARLRLHGYTTMFGGAVQAAATLSQGVDLFDATRGGHPLASRDDADGRFTSLALSADGPDG